MNRSRAQSPAAAAGLAIAAILVAGVALAGTAGPVRGATHEIPIANFAFVPEELTITAGDTVTWTNEDVVIHTATSVDGAFDSGDLAQGESWSMTFNTPGTYDYLCTPHPFMVGRIIVVAAPATPSPQASSPAATPGASAPGATPGESAAGARSPGPSAGGDQLADAAMREPMTSSAAPAMLALLAVTALLAMLAVRVLTRVLSGASSRRYTRRDG